MQIKVNDADLKSLSDTDKDKIKQIMTKTFKNDVELVGDPSVESVMKSGGAGTVDLGGFCTSLCNLAQSAAESLCNRLSDGAPKQICLVAAATAGDLCRSKC